MEPIEFGKYRLYDRLAEGGMAVVWRAKLHGPGGFEKQLVVKQIRPELAARAEFIDLFVAEAKLTVSLTHANIVPVFELGMVDGVYFLALELIDGPPLREVIEKGPVSPFLAGYIVEQVLRGLDYAHRRGVVHRDLSSGNVVVSREGEVKIVDFGIAAGVDTAGVRGGSRGYVAPEQEAGGRSDARSDLYAVGILMWELLSGRRYDGSAPTAPDAMAALITKATAADPAERFADAASMLAALTRFLRDVSYAPNQLELSSLVRKRCPDLVPSEDGDGGDEPERHEGPRTAALPGRGRQVTFATRIGEDPPPAAAPARRSTLVAAIGAVALAAGVAWIVRPTGGPPTAATGTSGIAAPPPTAPASPPPRPRTLHLIVRSDPPGAEARLDDRALGLTPVAVDLDAATGSLRLRRRGYSPVEIALTRADFTGEPPSATIARTLAPLPRGQLTLNALPWAHVTIDGEKVGDSPLAKLPLAAGPHAVRLECPPTGRDFKFNLVVEPNKETRRVVDLRGEPKIIE